LNAVYSPEPRETLLLGVPVLGLMLETLRRNRRTREDRV